MTRELYVYFRAPDSRADAVRAAATEMQSRLRHDHPELQARLLRRPEAPGGQHTWMETYAADGGVSEGLGRIIEQRAAAWSGLLDGHRHVEVFYPCA